MKLDARKMQILQAVIDDYILTAAPIGSRTISKRADFNLSSATIRNEMSDLEEMGYLEQPHTSAGRIPSDKAYRLYVNNIMRRAELSEDEKKFIRKYFEKKTDEVEAVVKQAAAALSDITRYTAMVLPPQLHAIRLKHLQLVPVTSDRALLVLVTDAGFVRDAMIRVPEGFCADDLEKLSKALTQRLRDQRLDEITLLELAGFCEELGQDRSFFNSVLDAIGRNVQPGAQSVELSGTSNIFAYPEYSDLGKAKQFLAAIEGKDTLYRMLQRAAPLEFSITIGGENEQPELKGCSIVTATYKMGNDPLGSFGIIGPTRMPYARVLSIMEYISMSLSEALLGILDDEQR